MPGSSTFHPNLRHLQWRAVLPGGGGQIVYLMCYRWLLITAVSLTLITTLPLFAGEPSHGMAYFGNLKYGPDMTHFDYVNPKAPKGGRMKFGVTGTYNNFNSYVDKGNLALWISPNSGLGSYIYDPLMRKAEDELASY